MLYFGDCIDVLKKFKNNTIDLVFADPPYFLSNGGKSIRSGKIVSVNKGDWDIRENYTDTLQFTRDWLFECHRLLKETGTIWISGTKHNIFDIEKVLKELKFKIINIIIWHKSDPPPLIYKNKFRFSYEFIIWAKKGNKHYFNYNLMYEISKTEMEDVWTIPAVHKNEKKFGYHPTQKPVKLLERIILSSSKIGDTILDPFLGSGTTYITSKKLERNCIGIEKNSTFYNISKKRINSIL